MASAPQFPGHLKSLQLSQPESSELTEPAVSKKTDPEQSVAKNTARPSPNVTRRSISPVERVNTWFIPRKARSVKHDTVPENERALKAANETERVSTRTWPNGEPPVGPRSHRGDISPPALKRNEYSFTSREYDSYRPSADHKSNSTRTSYADRDRSNARSPDYEYDQESSHGRSPLSSSRTKSSAVEITSDRRPNTNGSTTRRSTTLVWKRRLSTDDTRNPERPDTAKIPRRLSSAAEKTPLALERQTAPKRFRKQLADEGVGTAGEYIVANAQAGPSRRVVDYSDLKYSPSLRSQAMSLEDGEYSPSLGCLRSPGEPTRASHEDQILPIISTEKTPQAPLCRTPRFHPLEIPADEQVSQTLRKRLRLNTPSLMSESGSSTSSQKGRKRCRICTGSGELFPLSKCVVCRASCHEMCGITKAAVVRDGLEVTIGGLHCNLCSTQSAIGNVQADETEAEEDPKLLDGLPIYTTSPRAAATPTHRGNEIFKAITSDRDHDISLTSSVRPTPAELKSTSINDLAMRAPSQLFLREEVATGSVRQPPKLQQDPQQNVHRSNSFLHRPRRNKDYSCRYWKNGNCRFSDSECDFAHYETELGSVLPNKQLTCYYWHTNGYCVHSDDKCIYAHVDTGVYAQNPRNKSNDGFEDVKDDRPPDKAGSSVQTFQKSSTSLNPPSRWPVLTKVSPNVQEGWLSATEDNFEASTSKIDLRNSRLGQNNSSLVDELPRGNYHPADPRLQHRSYSRGSFVSANTSIAIGGTPTSVEHSHPGAPISEPRPQIDLDVTQPNTIGTQNSHPQDFIEPSEMAPDDQRRVRPKCPRCNQKELFNSRICKTCRESEQESRRLPESSVADGRSASPATSALSATTAPQPKLPRLPWDSSDDDDAAQAPSVTVPTYQDNMHGAGQGIGQLKRPSAEDYLFLPRKKAKLIIPGVGHAGAARKTVVPPHPKAPDERPKATIVASPVDMDDEPRTQAEKPTIPQQVRSQHTTQPTVNMNLTQMTELLQLRKEAEIHRKEKDAQQRKIEELEAQVRLAKLDASHEHLPAQSSIETPPLSSAAASIALHRLSETSERSEVSKEDKNAPKKILSKSKLTIVPNNMADIDATFHPVHEQAPKPNSSRPHATIPPSNRPAPACRSCNQKHRRCLHDTDGNWDSQKCQRWLRDGRKDIKKYNDNERRDILQASKGLETVSDERSKAANKALQQANDYDDDDEEEDSDEDLPLATVRRNVPPQRPEVRISAHDTRLQQGSHSRTKPAKPHVLTEEELDAIDKLKKRGVVFEDESEDDDDSDSSSDTPIMWTRSNTAPPAPRDPLAARPKQSRFLSEIAPELLPPSAATTNNMPVRQGRKAEWKNLRRTQLARNKREHGNPHHEVSRPETALRRAERMITTTEPASIKALFPSGPSTYSTVSSSAAGAAGTLDDLLNPARKVQVSFLEFLDGPEQPVACLAGTGERKTLAFREGKEKTAMGGDHSVVAAPAFRVKRSRFTDGDKWLVSGER